MNPNEAWLKVVRQHLVNILLQFIYEFLIGIILLMELSVGHTAENKSSYKWIPANEVYFLLSATQNLYLPDNDNTEKVKPWGFGFKIVGNEKFSKTGGFQFQSIKISNPLTGSNTFYLWELLAGIEYISPQIQQKHLHWTASTFATLGLSRATFYAAPVISIGVLYVTDLLAPTPNGFTFNIFYRLTDIDLDDVGNDKKGILKPVFGFKMGYVFEGFWSIIEKSKE